MAVFWMPPMVALTQGHTATAVVLIVWSPVQTMIWLRNWGYWDTDTPELHGIAMLTRKRMINHWIWWFEGTLFSCKHPSSLTIKYGLHILTVRYYIIYWRTFIHNTKLIISIASPQALDSNWFGNWHARTGFLARSLTDGPFRCSRGCILHKDLIRQMNATCSFPSCEFNLLAWLGLILEDTVTSSILHCLNVLRKTLTCTIAFPCQDDAHAHQDGDGLGAHNWGTGQFLKRVLHCGEDSNDLPMPGCREVGFSGCTAHCHDCTRAQGGPQCAGQVSVMQVWVNIEYCTQKNWMVV